ncbi:MAG: hypothetical protein SXV54_07355 [Chloroflexota bacterium]|nr:hypothetical protein [Chloroflexota bacterium]
MEAVKAVSAEIVGWGVAGCAAILALVIALGGVEGQIGEMFSIPGLSASPRVRVIVVILALLVAASAIPISNAIVDALW